MKLKESDIDPDNALMAAQPFDSANAAGAADISKTAENSRAIIPG